MRLNRLLAEVTGLPDDFGEWPYFLSFYGEPSAERPWAWQIDGHHLCLNGTVIGDQFLLTPVGSGLRSGPRRHAAEPPPRRGDRIARRLRRVAVLPVLLW